jgi:hypothetical protein
MIVTSMELVRLKDEPPCFRIIQAILQAFSPGEPARLKG